MASESQTPTFRRNTDAYLLVYCWHGQTNEGIVHHWCRLYVGHKDLHVLPQVKGGGVTGPPTLHFHHIEGYTPQQVFES